MSKKYEQNKKDLDFWLEAIKSVTPLADKKHKAKRKVFLKKILKKQYRKKNN